MDATLPRLDLATRSQFPILHQDVNGQPLVYLDNAATSQKPKRVVDAIDRYYNSYNSNIHRGVHTLAGKATEAYENARQRIASFIGAPDSACTLFTSGTTASLNLVAQSWGMSNLKEGDVVLVTRMDHHSNLVPWQLIAERTGARVLPIEIDRAGNLLLEPLQEQLNTLPVKVVSFPHVSNALGTILPAKKIVQMAHEAGSIAVVDGAQAVPHARVNVVDLDADFYAFSGHKMYGPTGIGMLYGKREWLDAMQPWQGGGEMIATASFDGTTYNTLPHKFEAGTPNIVGGIALEAAVDFMEETGVESIAAWEDHLLQRATEQLAAVEGMTFYGTAEHKAGVLSFLIEGVHPYDLGTLLDQQGVAVRTGHHCTEPLMDWLGIPGTVRASFACYNSEEDVDRLTAAVQKAAAMLR